MQIRAASAMMSRNAHDESTIRRPPQAPPRRLKVAELLEGQREAILEHSGQDYRLRITANGKLILTK
jgi:hemin uptake protein HemP